MIRSHTTIATPPGATIREQLENRGMRQNEFAKRMGMTEKHISHLINGAVRLTPDVALRLEMVLGIPARVWNNLEAIYQEKAARAIAENEMDADIELAKSIPYKEMALYGWVESVKDSTEKVYNLRRFFEIAKLEVLSSLTIPGIAFRRTAASESSDYALAAWAQKARIEARSIETAKINLKKLEDSISEIRDMTTKSPAIFCPQLSKLLATCGIAIIFLPHIGGSFLHGASFYDGDHIVIGLTVRGKDADKFWFSLFHELCHILKGHISDHSGTTEEQEQEADAFARDVLIPPDIYQQFTDHNSFGKESIVVFAKRIGIDPGIIVGRLQKEGYIQYNWHNDLKTKYRISD